MTIKTQKIIYWASTVLICLMMLMSGGMYIAKHDMIMGGFQKLQYPAFMVYPLAIAKILGVIAILTNYSRFLKEWAYAGFFFVFCLALSGHYMAGEVNNVVGPIIALLLLIVSRYFWGKLMKEDVMIPKMG